MTTTLSEGVLELIKFKKSVEASLREQGEADGYYLVNDSDWRITAKAMNDLGIENGEPNVDFDPNTPGLEDTYTYFEGYIAGILEKLAELKVKIRVRGPMVEEPKVEEPKDFLMVSEVAKLLRCDEDTVTAMIRRGQLRAFTTSPPKSRRPRWRIPLEAIRELGASKVESPPPEKTPTRQPKKNVKHWFR